MPSPPRSIEDLFASIGGEPNSLTHEEYHALAHRIREIAPARLLVFGVGRDSQAWIETNHGGSSLFLENNPVWIAKVAAEINPALIRETHYRQTFERWEASGFDPGIVQLPELDDPPFDHSWDVVFVDAPWGPTFGRHQSTRAATEAVTPGGLVALHDCEREREQLICRHLLEARGFTLEAEHHRLRIYRAPS